MKRRRRTAHPGAARRTEKTAVPAAMTRWKDDNAEP